MKVLKVLLQACHQTRHPEKTRFRTPLAVAFRTPLIDIDCAKGEFRPLSCAMRAPFRVSSRTARTRARSRRARNARRSREGTRRYRNPGWAARRAPWARTPVRAWALHCSRGRGSRRCSRRAASSSGALYSMRLSSEARPRRTSLRVIGSIGASGRSGPVVGGLAALLILSGSQARNRGRAKRNAHERAGRKRGPQAGTLPMILSFRARTHPVAWRKRARDVGFDPARRWPSVT